MWKINTFRKSLMNSKFLKNIEDFDLYLVILISLAESTSVLFDQGNLVNNIVGIVFSLFAPGYAFLSAIFYKEDELTYIERISLSFILNIALVTFIGLIFNFSPYGINLSTITFSLLLLTLIFTAVALIKRRSNRQLNILKDFTLRQGQGNDSNSHSKVTKTHAREKTNLKTASIVFMIGWILIFLQFLFFTSLKILHHIGLILLLISTITFITKKREFSLFLVIASMLLLRTLPYYIEILPIAPDEWRYFNIIQDIMHSGNFNFANLYDNWPTSYLLAVTLIHLSGLDTITCIVIISKFLMLPLFYMFAFLIAKKLTDDYLATGSLVFMTVLFWKIFNNATLFSPAQFGDVMYLSSIYVLLSATRARNKKMILIYLINIFLLMLSHHLTGLVISVVICSFYITGYFFNIYFKKHTIYQINRNIVLLTILPFIGYHIIWNSIVSNFFLNLTKEVIQILLFGIGPLKSNPIVIGELRITRIFEIYLPLIYIFVLGTIGLFLSFKKHFDLFTVLLSWGVGLGVVLVLSQYLLKGYTLEPSRFIYYLVFPGAIFASYTIEQFTTDKKRSAIIYLFLFCLGFLANTSSPYRIQYYSMHDKAAVLWVKNNFDGYPVFTDRWLELYLLTQYKIHVEVDPNIFFEIKPIPTSNYVVLINDRILTGFYSYEYRGPIFISTIDSYYKLYDNEYTYIYVP